MDKPKLNPVDLSYRDEHVDALPGADKATHDDQLEAWAGELTFALMGWLKEPESYDDKVQLNSALKTEIKSIVETAFDLATPSPAVPEGWKLVPVEPTPEMIGAFWRQKNRGTQEIGKFGGAYSDYDAYRAMLSASPASTERG